MRWPRLPVLALALAGFGWAGSARAQFVDEYDVGISPGATVGSPFLDRGAAEVGEVNGVITHLDTERGLMVLSTGTRNLRIHARPDQLIGLARNMRVNATYRNYGGYRWLTFDQGLGGAGLGTVDGLGGGFGTGFGGGGIGTWGGGIGFGGGGLTGGGLTGGGLGIGGAGIADFTDYGRLVGSVDRLDRERGVLVVDGRALRAHPEDLDAVLPGQAISVEYAQIGNTRWVVSGF